LEHNQDCTSTLAEVVAIYTAGINELTGERGEIGQGANGLCLDHVHNGPAVGLIPGWLNGICTRYAEANWETVCEYMNRRKQVCHEGALDLGRTFRLEA
jgi:hypothetical protein